jgi:hypothetical protein
VKLSSCKATIRNSRQPLRRDENEIDESRLIDISIIAAIAVSLGISGHISAIISYDDNLASD